MEEKSETEACFPPSFLISWSYELWRTFSSRPDWFLPLVKDLRERQATYGSFIDWRCTGYVIELPWLVIFFSLSLSLFLRWFQQSWLLTQTFFPLLLLKQVNNKLSIDCDFLWHCSVSYKYILHKKETVNQHLWQVKLHLYASTHTDIQRWLLVSQWISYSGKKQSLEHLTVSCPASQMSYIIRQPLCDFSQLVFTVNLSTSQFACSAFYCYVHLSDCPSVSICFSLLSNYGHILSDCQHVSCLYIPIKLRLLFRLDGNVAVLENSISTFIPTWPLLNKTGKSLGIFWHFRFVRCGPNKSCKSWL